MDKTQTIKVRAARAVLLKHTLALSGDGTDAHTIITLGAAIESMAEMVLTFEDFRLIRLLVAHGHLSVTDIANLSADDILATLPSEKWTPDPPMPAKAKATRLSHGGYVAPDKEQSGDRSLKAWSDIILNPENRRRYDHH